VLVFLFVSGRVLEPDAVAILTIGAGIYAFLESVHSGWDDNVVAALPTALAIYQMGLRWPAGSARPAGDSRAVGVAFALNAAAAVLTLGLKIVSPSGAAAGAITGFLVVAAGRARPYALLWLFFLAGTAATRLGYRRKSEAGVAQPRRGRRGAAHVVANCAVP